MGFLVTRPNSTHLTAIKESTEVGRKKNTVILCDELSARICSFSGDDRLGQSEGGQGRLRRSYASQETRVTFARQIPILSTSLQYQLL